MKINSNSFPRLVLQILLLAGVIVFVLDAVLNFGRVFEYVQLRRIVNIAREGSVPSWLSVIQFFLISQVSLLNTIRTKEQGGSKFRRWGWFGSALFFLFLSIDDDAQIHERIGTVSKLISEAGNGAHQGWLGSLLEHFHGYHWQIVVAPFIIICALIVFRFLWKEFESPLSRRYLFYACICLAISFGLDVIEGLDDGYRVLIDTFSLKPYTVEHFAKGLEETLELFASALLLSSVLTQLLPLKIEFQAKEN